MNPGGAEVVRCDLMQSNVKYEADTTIIWNDRGINNRKFSIVNPTKKNGMRSRMTARWVIVGNPRTRRKILRTDRGPEPQICQAPVSAQQRLLNLPNCH